MPNAVTTNTEQGWNQDNLRDHLQAAVYLELWTIPMYMTALYSIKDPSTGTTPVLPSNGAKPTNDEQRVFALIHSVFIQEMLHLQLAANIYNALFWKTANPLFTGDWAPSYDSGIPFIESLSTAQIGPADRTRARLFMEIERPEPRNAVIPTEPEALYDTIGEFYNAVAYGIDQLWGQLYDETATADQMRQKNVFGSMYPGIPAVIQGSSADAKAIVDTMIAAIVDQGEGAAGPLVPEDDQPIDDDTPVDGFSHYARFRRARRLIRKGITTWPLSHHGGSDAAGALEAAQTNLNASLAAFLGSLERDFGTAGSDVNLDAMGGFAGKTTAVWQQGGIPEMDTDATGSAGQIKEIHVCQGLNTCEGHGRDGTGTKAGDGACATAIEHACGGTNTCRSQGGCGYLTQGRSDPGDNDCKGAGGCGSPIPPTQHFEANATYTGNVWDKARELFETRLKAAGITDVAPKPTEPSQWRKNLQNTNSKST